MRTVSLVVLGTPAAGLQATKQIARWSQKSAGERSLQVHFGHGFDELGARRGSSTAPTRDVYRHCDNVHLSLCPMSAFCMNFEVGCQVGV